MTVLLVIGVVVVALVAYVALRNAQDFSDANEIVPGVDTGAPKAWAGAHSTEAKLHRRLRDACEALRVNASLDDPSLQPVRAGLEEQAIAVDRRLVAVAALPAARRQQPLEQVARAVDAVEEAVAGVVALRGPSPVDVSQALDEVRMRAALVEEARAELEALTAPTPDLEQLRRELGDDDVDAVDPADPAGDEGPRPAPGT